MDLILDVYQFFLAAYMKPDLEGAEENAETGMPVDAFEDAKKIKDGRSLDEEPRAAIVC